MVEAIKKQPPLLEVPKHLEERMNKPEPFGDPDALYAHLINHIKKYHPSADISIIEKAYELANKYHSGQVRKSGEPYIIHPISVAIILAELEMDKETIAAGILHDVVEDTPVTKEELEAQFGSEVALLVDGVTKLTQLTYTQDKIEVQAENLRKMFLAMAKDIRVIIIKLADRLHNMRTLQYMKRTKQIEKALETMDIYAPIAQRLGISKIKIELEDLSLKYLHPEIYFDLSDKIAQKRSAREEFIDHLVTDVSGYMKEAEIEGEIDGRVKHFFSIFKKMISQDKTLDQIYDLFAIRIKVERIQDCYAALGVIHEKYKPIPGRFKDYIAMPKPNMYQSLHTTLIAENGQPFEVQIRTFEMHRTAEYGIAAHWKYKLNPSEKNYQASEEEKLSWLRQILEWQQDMSDNKEFLSLLKSDLDLFGGSVYCFTPQGDVKTLPAGSTPIDFAYSIHSAVGNKMVGARVNGKIVTIDYEIKNGDRIEIITSANSKGPSRDWLNIVQSTQAKNKINQWFKAELKEDNIVKGKELLERYMKAKSIDAKEIIKPEYTAKVISKYGFRDWDSLMATVGHGGLKEGQIVNRILEEYNKKNKPTETDKDVLEAAAANAQKPVHGAKGGIVVKGINDVAARCSKCCGPIPGDEIVGFVTRGRGVSIHRTDCVNIINLSEIERARLIDAEWQKPEGKEAGEMYTAEIVLYAVNRMGLLVDISKVMTEAGIDVLSINSRVAKQDRATISMSFPVRSVEELNRVITKLNNIPDIIDVERSAG